MWRRGQHFHFTLSNFFFPCCILACLVKQECIVEEKQYSPMDSRRILSWLCTTLPYFRKPWYEYTDWRTYRKKKHHSQTRLGGGGSREILDLMLLWDCRTSRRRRDNRSPIWYLIGIDPVEQLKILTVGKSIHFRHGAVPCIVSVCFCVELQSLETHNNKKKGVVVMMGVSATGSRVTHQREQQSKGGTGKWGGKKRINDREKEGGNAGNTETESKRWEKQQTSFNISSEMIYSSTLWQHYPPGLTKPTKSSIMEARRAWGSWGRGDVKFQLVDVLPKKFMISKEQASVNRKIYCI